MTRWLGGRSHEHPDHRSYHSEFTSDHLHQCGLFLILAQNIEGSKRSVAVFQCARHFQSSVEDRNWSEAVEFLAKSLLMFGDVDRSPSAAPQFS